MDEYVAILQQVVAKQHACLREKASPSGGEVSCIREYALIIESSSPIEVVSLSKKVPYVPACLRRIGDFISSDITEIYGTTFGKLMGYTG